MPRLSQLRTSGLFAHTVELQDFLELDEPTWIKLREPTNEELAEMGFVEGNTEQQRQKYINKFLDKNFHKFLVDHNIENDNGEKASNEEVAKFVREVGTLFQHITTEWLKKTFSRINRTGNSDSSAEATSTAET